MRYIIGLDVGGTKCAVTIGSAEGSDVKVLDKKGFATNEVKTSDEFFKK